MKKRVVVFGGRGFIGSNFCKILKEKKIHFVVVGSDKINFLKKNSVTKSLDLLRKDDYIFFSCALAPCKNLKMYEENFKMIMNFAKVLMKFKDFNKLIYISSDAVFTDTLNKINENSCKSPNNYHGLMHYQREVILKSIVPQNKICIIRPTLVFGKKDPHNGYGPNQFYRLAKESKPIKLFGKGEERRDHIFIDDLSNIIFKCFKSNFYGEINAVTGKLISFLEIAKYFQKKYDVKIEYTKRNAPIPHNGYRAFNNNKLKKLFPNFKFSKFKNYLSNLN